MRMQAEEVEDAEAMAEEGPARAQSLLLLLEMLQVCRTACILHNMTGAQVMRTPHPPDNLYASCHCDAIHSLCIAHAWPV